MRGVRISGIDLDSDGRVVVEKLADIFEDGEVVGESYLASSLRKSVVERGPTPLSTVIRRYNNGYTGASLIEIPQRLWEKIDRSGDCWLWTGAKSATGYGYISKSRGESGSRLAHRWMYELFKGPIPTDFEIDHLCRTPSCVRPDHLEAVLHRTNILRGDTFAADQVKRTVCPQGHPYTKENTYWQGRKRSCLACRHVNNQDTVSKGRVYIKEDSEAPEGAQVREGPRGGKYYDTEARRGRPIGEAPKDWMPKVGERIRFRWPGDRFNGRLGRITKIDGMYAQIKGVGWTGGAGVRLDEGKIVPAPYTAKEKREMKARDIMVQEFGTTDHISMDKDAVTHLEYDIYLTDAGPNLWVKREKEGDPPWMAQKDSALSMGGFLRALPNMNVQALAHMKKHVERIVFSPVSNPNDRATSKQIGKKFTSAASMDMKIRTMRIWPIVKGVNPQRLAQTLTHETGHAVDDMRQKLGSVYLRKLREFWAEMDEQDVARPATISGHRAVEEERGVPSDPTQWIDAYELWKDFDLGVRSPSHVRFWRALSKEGAWNSLTATERNTIKEAVRGVEPVSKYAHSNEHEYYAEAYTHYQAGALDKEHVMYDHFENLERVKQWVQS